ncbi:PAS domain-containing protein [Pontibacter vulgaris]|uniref:PAS domain-containing protein n=1 Tax=Pontibacter vulgaris TaxID=2905679 RepID=UPI001FA79D53|nr:PAS domain-containing protein [Pontibacter vulgaris]
MIFRNRLNIAYHSGKTIKFVAVAFGVLLAALVAVSMLSFLGARKVQINYNAMVADAMYKLDLINSLHENEDAIYNKVLEHLSTANPELKLRYAKDIDIINAQHQVALNKLDQLLQDREHEKILHAFISEQRIYQDHIKQQLDLSQQGKLQETQTYNIQVLTPAYQVHQHLLKELSAGIRDTIQGNGDHAVESFNGAVRKYKLLLILTFFLALAGALLLRHVIKRLRRDNLLLNAEIQERQQLEMALNESSRQYKMLFEHNPLPMLVYDQHTCKFIAVNQAASDEYGYTREEFLEMTFYDLLPVDEIEQSQRQLSRTNRFASATDTLRHKRKDDTTFTVEVISHPLPEQADHHPRLAIAVNIEERVQASKLIEHNEKQLREISSSLPGVVYQFQMDSNQKFSFPYVSEGIVELYGVHPSEVYADPDKLFKDLHPQDVPAMVRSTQQSYQTLTPWMLEFRIWHARQKKWKWLRGHSMPTLKENGVIIWNGTFIDITFQKEAQEKLAESEANLRALHNSSPQAIYLLDEHLNIVSFNAVAQTEVKSYLLKDLQTGQSILEFVDTSLKQEILKHHAQAIQGETIVYETGNGSYWHEIAFRPVFNSRGKVQAVSLSINNISERKKAIETIKRNEAQLERAQQLAHFGNWEYDLQRELLHFSDEVYHIYGVSKSDFRPTFANVVMRFHPEDRAMALEKYNEALANNSELRLEHRILHSDGTVRYLYHIGEIIRDENGNAIRVTATVQDITERIKREQEVRAAKNLLQSTLENIPEVIFSMGTDAVLTYISQQCHELTGYTVEDFMANPKLWFSIMRAQDKQQLLGQIIPNLLAGQSQQCEVCIIRRDRVIKWLMLRISPKLDEKGNVIRLDGSASDMTEYKIAENKRNDLTEQLLKQNQNLQQFAYIVSHNLRAPIANILGLTSIYDRKRPDQLLNNRVIDNLFKSAKLLDSTIRDLNDILTIRSEINKVKEEVAFCQLLEHVKDGLSDELEKSDARLEYDFEDAPTLLTIRSYAYSIMLNLISNALKYRSPDRKLYLQVKTLRLHGYICLMVSDNGLGIDLEKEKEKVFGLYKRFHHDKEGKGIGLHLVKTQTELLGGKVEVESQVGVGTTFHVYFKS